MLGTTKFGEAWLHHSPMLALVHLRSILAALEFLHVVAHNFGEHLLLLGLRKNLLIQPFLSCSSSPAQEVIPLTNLLYPQ
jgi:hypothetical protein